MGSATKLYSMQLENILVILTLSLAFFIYLFLNQTIKTTLAKLLAVSELLVLFLHYVFYLCSTLIKTCYTKHTLK